MRTRRHVLAAAVAAVPVAGLSLVKVPLVNYATTTQLNAEIANRMAADAALASRIAALEAAPAPTSGVTFAGDWAAAIAAAPANGNLINVPAGTWPSPPITPYAGLTIRGAGPTSVITRVGTPTTPDVGLVDTRVTDVTVTDLTLRGTGHLGGTGDDCLIFGLGAHRLRVQRVRLENAQGIGIQTMLSTDGLVEDLTISNVYVRGNGYHGVGLWPYKGTRRWTYRRIAIDGCDYAGVMLDAGTTGSVDAQSVDDNVFEDVTITNAARGGGLVGVGAGFMFTGGSRNSALRTSVGAQSQGPAFAFGIDQSGIGSTGNVLHTTTLASIVSGIAIAFDPAADGNTFDGVTGTGLVQNASGNTVLNAPGLVLA